VSTPPPDRASWFRVLGLALIGVAVVMAVAGVYTRGRDGGLAASQAAQASSAAQASANAPARSNQTRTGALPTAPPPAAPSPTAPPPAAPSPTAPPPTAPPPTDPSPTSAAPPGTETPLLPTTPATSTAAPPASTPPPGQVRTSVAVTVLNNSTTTGLAGRAATALRNLGWNVPQVGNFGGATPTTTAYYGPGPGEQAAAELLATDIGATAAPRVAGLPNGAVVLVVTGDFRG